MRMQMMIILLSEAAALLAEPVFSGLPPLDVFALGPVWVVISDCGLLFSYFVPESFVELRVMVLAWTGSLPLEYSCRVY